MTDHTFVKKSGLNNEKVTRVKRGAECWIDHRMVLTEISISMHPPNRKRQVRRIELNTSIEGT